jgi:hypothetical protein
VKIRLYFGENIFQPYHCEGELSYWDAVVKPAKLHVADHMLCNLNASTVTPDDSPRNYPHLTEEKTVEESLNLAQYHKTSKWQMLYQPQFAPSQVTTSPVTYYHMNVLCIPGCIGPVWSLYKLLVFC